MPKVTLNLLVQPSYRMAWPSLLVQCFQFHLEKEIKNRITESFNEWISESVSLSCAFFLGGGSFPSVYFVLFKFQCASGYLFLLCFISFKKESKRSWSNIIMVFTLPTNNKAIRSSQLFKVRSGALF